MNKIFLYLYCITLVCLSSLAHPQDVRTNKTVVADVLAQMPADKQDEYNQQIKDLVATGEEGILQLVQQLNPTGQGSNAEVAFALSGIAHYVADNQHENERIVTAQALKKAVTIVNDKNIQAFLNSLLRVVDTTSENQQAAITPAPDKKIDKNTPVYLKIAQLKKTIDNATDEKSVAKLVLAALKDTSVQYRTSALRFASDKAGKYLYTTLIKTLTKAKPDAQINIIDWIGYEAAQSPEKQNIINALEIGIEINANQVISAGLNSKNENVRSATAWTLVKLSNPAAIPQLANLLTSNDPANVNLGKQTLASFHGNVADPVAKIIPAATDSGKIAAIQLLALRKASNHLNDVLELTKHNSTNVSDAAYIALKDVVGEKDLVNMCGMLESATQETVHPLQQAVTAALLTVNKNQQVETMVRRMYQAGDNKKYLYYKTLAATNNPQALQIISKAFFEGNGNDKKEAFDALLQWNGPEVADIIFDVCQDPNDKEYHQQAAETYVKLVANPNLTGENRLIFLRKAMKINPDNKLKNTILKHVGNTGTFLALLFAGEFLDQETLKETAANAVMNIALNHPEYIGDIVTQLLQEAAVTLDNPDADYQRQSIQKHLDALPKETGFVSIFNGKDLAGWKGLVGDPISRSKMKPAELAKAQAKANQQMINDWHVENGLLLFNGTGYDNLCTEKQYADFEMYVDWKLDPSGHEADAGIYLRGTPQVQIWDTARVKAGAQVGSGGLYNNQIHPSKPLKVADNKLGEWNTLYIKMIGDRVTVKLNGELVVDDVILENYWDRKQPIPPIEQIELQAHGSLVYYRNIYVKEIPRPAPFQLSSEEIKEGFQILFDGTNMYGWQGNLVNYSIEGGCIVMNPNKGGGKAHGNLYTKEEYGDFVFRFEFQLTPAANNGLGVRTPMEGDPAYNGMELQILDNEHPVYRELADYQYHGSIYGVIPAKRGYLKPTGEWNYQEVIADGDHIKITLNETVILDGNIRDAARNGTADGVDHPGLFNQKGYIGFLGHGSEVKFKNIRLKKIR